MKKMLAKWTCILISVSVLWTCGDSEEKNIQELMSSYKLTGTYRAQITPSFMGITPITTGVHPVRIDDLGDGTIRFYFEKFRQQSMPFQMTVDIRMRISKGTGNTLFLLRGEKGVFKAELPSGENISPGDLPPGIQLPEGAESGMHSSQAEIKGSYGRIEKEGKTELRFDLDLTPGIPLPIQILIYTYEKISD